MSKQTTKTKIDVRIKRNTDADIHLQKVKST